MIARVEQFRANNGHVPSYKEAAELMRRLGWIPSESCPCYRETGRDSYEIWFGTTLGSSMTYRSKSRTWREEG